MEVEGACLEKRSNEKAAGTTIHSKSHKGDNKIPVTPLIKTCKSNVSPL